MEWTLPRPVSMDQPRPGERLPQSSCHTDDADTGRVRPVGPRNDHQCHRPCTGDGPRRSPVGKPSSILSSEPDFARTGVAPTTMLIDEGLASHRAWRARTSITSEGLSPMVTRAQRLEINRINASKSTGPKS